MKKLKFTEEPVPKKLLKLDLGCGKLQKTPEGFLGVDLHPYPGVKVVDLRKPWPWKDNSVDEVQSIYLLHCLTMPQRVHFANELFRVLKKGAQATIYSPHFAAARAYGDPACQWPPVTEEWFPWLKKEWRDTSLSGVDTSGLKCNFEYTLGVGMHPAILSRNIEYQQHAIMFWKEAAQDLIVTLTKP